MSLKSMFSVKERDNKYFYTLLLITIICSLFYISNEYIYSKRVFSYTNTSYLVFQNLNEQSTITLHSDLYPALATFYFSDIYTFDESKLYDIQYMHITETQEIMLNKTYTNDYQHWVGCANFTEGSTTLPADFTANQGTYDSINVEDFKGHENALKLQENSTSLTSIRVANANIGNNGGFEIFVNVHYANPSTFAFQLNPCLSAWNQWTHVYFYQNGDIKIHYTGDNYVTTNFTFAYDNWYKITYNLTGTHRLVYINDSLEFVEANTNAINYIYIKTSDNLPGVYYLDGFKITTNGWDKVSHDNHYYCEYSETYELSEEVRYIYSYNLTFISETIKLFNYNSSEYELFDSNHNSSYLYQNSIKLRFYEYDSEITNINYSIQLLVYYFEHNFYDLFTYEAITEHNVYINETKIIPINYSINLTAQADFYIEIDSECFYTLLIIIQYNITDVVSE